jgi:tRNA threonylcarbamoyladenosine biosynthesis protein TsaB
LALLLNIETATTVCSVAITRDSEILSLIELDNGFTHAENLHLFIGEALKKAGVAIRQIEGIAVSKGPGSYTGLRIGASTAKGLAYALNIPLISVDTLMIMAEMARQANPAAGFFCPMIDARRMEVYTALYDRQLDIVIPVQALVVDEQSASTFRKESICFFGDGMDKCRGILSGIETATFIAGIKPSAKYMGALAEKKFRNQEFEDVAYFEPFYLKDFLIVKKKGEG